jgi:hypothetical protein
MKNIPSPPPGGDVNRGPVILIVGWLEFIIALVFLCGRLYAKIKINHSIALDDWVMILCFVS